MCVCVCVCVYVWVCVCMCVCVCVCVLKMKLMIYYLRMTKISSRGEEEQVERIFLKIKLLSACIPLSSALSINWL